jgi:HEAT repeat protein
MGALALLLAAAAAPFPLLRAEDASSLEEDLRSAASSFVEGSVREKAIKALCQRPPGQKETEDRIVASLGSALADIEDSEVRLLILERLDKSQSERVADAIAKVLKTETKDEALITKAIEVFTKRSTAKHLNLLIELARQEHPSVHRAAVKAIDGINTVEALNTLVGLVEEAVKNGNMALAEATLQPIGLRMEHQLDEWAGDEGFDLWARRVADLLPRIAGLQREKLKASAAKAAAALAAPRDLPMLIRLGLKDAVPPMASRWALRMSYEELAASIAAEDEAQREFGLSALSLRAAETPPPDADAFYARLLQAAKDISFARILYRVLRDVPVAAVKQETKARLLDRVRDALTHEQFGPLAAACIQALGGNEEDRGKAQSTLDRLGQAKGVSLAGPPDNIAVPTLAELMSHGDPRLLQAWRAAMKRNEFDYQGRANLTRALWSCRAPEVVSLLQESFRDRFVPVRLAAAEALKHFPGQEPAQKLVSAIETDCWDVQMVASRALAWNPDPKVDDQLVALLKSQSWRARAAAVLTLGRRHGPVAVEAIARHVEDRPVCRYAIEALGLHGTPEASKRLVALLASSKDPNVLCFGMATAARYGLRDASDTLSKLAKDESTDIAFDARKALFELSFEGFGQVTR